MLEINQFRVLDFIREQGHSTRAEVAASLGLSQPSVSRIVGRLIGMEMLHEGESARRTGGRPSRVIRYNTQLGAVMAFDVGGTKIHSALADLGGSILFERLSPTSEHGDAYSTLLAAVGVLQSEATSRGLSVHAMAVGVPALLEPKTDRVVVAPNVGWFDFDLKAQLHRDVAIPCVIENDANLAALAQAWRGAGRGTQCCVTLSIGTGIGAGIVVDGTLLRGKGGAAGEIGYLVNGIPQLRVPSEGHLGAFESIASGPAIVRRTKELLHSDPGPSVLDPDTVTPERVLEAAKRSDRVGSQIVEELLDHVAMALIAITVILSPDCIVLDGGVGRALEPWVDALRRRVAPRLLVVPELVVSRLGSNSTVAGGVAAAVVLAHQLSAPLTPRAAAMANLGGGVPRGSTAGAGAARQEEEPA